MNALVTSSIKPHRVATQGHLFPSVLSMLDATLASNIGSMTISRSLNGGTVPYFWPYFGGIFLYTGSIKALYVVGTSRVMAGWWFQSL